MKLKMKSGITLVALVITIIILLILAGVSIAILSNKGLLNKLEETREKHDFAELKEAVDIAYSTANINNYNNGQVTEKDIYDVLKEEGKYKVMADDESDGSFYVYSKLGKIYEIIIQDKNVILNYIGKGNIDEIDRIKSLGLSVTLDSISFNVSTSNITNTTEYKYYLSTDNGNNYDLKETSTNNIYTISNLEDTTTYYVKVEAIINGNLVQRTGIAKTTNILDLLKANAELIPDTTEWAKEVNVTLKLNEEVDYSNYTAQYLIGNYDEHADWTTYVNGIKVTENNTVWLRFYNIKKGTIYALSLKITNIDLTEPTASIEISKDSLVIGDDLSFVIKYQDLDSGINTCKYVINKTNETNMNESEFVNEVSSSSITTTINTNEYEEGTYYVHVLVTDKAGNKNQIVSSGIEISLYNVIRSSSLIEGIELIREDGIYSITVDNQTYNIHSYYYDGNQEWNENKTFGDSGDVATSTNYASNMVVVKVNGDLTIDKDVTVTAYASENGYGGPKGMFIACSGILTNNGNISMTARGAKAQGQNVYLWKNADNSYEYVPATGGAGGAATSAGSGKTSYGKKGGDGVNRGTGGGGSGCSNFGSGGSGRKRYFFFWWNRRRWRRLPK